jgi:hypothetical protein
MSDRNGKNIIRIPVAILIVALTAWAGCRRDVGDGAGQTEYSIKKGYSEGALSVTVKLSSDKVAISDLIIMEIEATTQQGWEVGMPAVSEVLSELDIRDRQSPGNRLADDNKVVRTRWYRLEPLVTGKAVVGAMDFKYWQSAEGEQAKYELTTEAIEIEVTSLLEELGTDLVIEDIEDVVGIEANRTVWWVCGGAAVMVGLVTVGIVLWLLLRPKKEAQIARIFRPAHEIAYAILRRIAEDKLVEKGRVGEFYERVSNCLRHYIEDRFGVAAPEQTTEEFLLRIEQSGELAVEYRDDLKGFLEHCDLVKFARYEPNAEQIEEALRLVEAFVDKTRSDAVMVDVTIGGAKGG